MSTEIQQAHNTELMLSDVQQKIITIRNASVILDSDVAALYGVETMRINEAVKNNPDKFPEGYIIRLENDEWKNLKSKFSISSWGGKTKLPNVFTEKGLYMLATILKSPKATNTTIAIVEAFAKLRELSNTVAELVQYPDDAQRQAAVAQKSSEMLSDMVTQELKKLRTTGTETTYEVNLMSAIKIKHTVKKELK